MDFIIATEAGWLSQRIFFLKALVHWSFIMGIQILCNIKLLVKSTKNPRVLKTNQKIETIKELL